VKVKLILFTLFLSAQCIAQKTTIGFGVGGSNYWGDLNTPSFINNVQQTNFAFQVHIKQYITPKLDIRFNALFGQLSGDDAKSSAEWQILRNVNFNSSLKEYSLVAEYSLVDVISDKAEYRFTPFIAAGIALFQFNPKTSYINDIGQTVSVELQPLGTEGQGLAGYPEKYSLSEISIPFGGGFRYAVNDNISIGIELIGRFTFTDYIDDISTNYPFNEDLLLNGQRGILASQLSYRGDELAGTPDVGIPMEKEGDTRGSESVKDYYFTGMLNLTYRLNGGLFSGNGGGGGMGCPTF